MDTEVRSDWGHASGGPSGEVDQSWARMRSPMSPPPSRNPWLGRT
jgi:hypothetical protein